MQNNEILPDYTITDYSGGVRTDKATAQLNDNELVFANNVEFLPGKVFKRYGSRAFGGFAVTPNANEIFVSGTYNKNLNVFLLANKNVSGDNGMVYGLVSTAAFSFYSTGVISISGATAGYSSSGQIEIEGNIITYTGKTAGSFTGVTGITTSPTHNVGATIKQWVGIYAAPVGTQHGVSFTYLNGLEIIGRGDQGTDIWNGTGYPTAITTIAPTALLVTTYKQRVYGVNYSNQSQVRFSNLNDGNTWDVNDYFMVEDDKGEKITNLKSYRSYLMIFKPNSTWYYNLSTLTQINSQVGCFNEQCAEEINNALYVFGPKGVSYMAGRYLAMTLISTPVKKWLDAFNSQLNTSTSGAIAYGAYPAMGRYNNKILIYIGDVTVDQVPYIDVCLVYDTIYKYWVIWTGFDNLQGFVSLQTYQDKNIIDQPMLFWGNDTQKFYQMFNNFNADASVPPKSVGFNFTSDKFYDTGKSIPAEVVTKIFYQKNPGWYKQYNYLRVFSERWPFSLEARTVTETGYSPWKDLGDVKGWETVKKLGDLTGFGIQFRIKEDSQNDPFTCCTMIIESTKLISQMYK